MTALAFIGLGNMGLPMAGALVRAGYEVRGADPNQEAHNRLKEAGGYPVESIAQAIDGAGAVISMLPSGKQVRAVYLGSEGVISVLGGRKDVLLIDCSTIDVTTAREVYASADSQGLTMVDAPVSGGTIGAELATLTFMVGGTDIGFEKARPYLEAMGKRLVYCGAAGTGQAAKICNNMILGISMIGVSEAFHLADRLGLDRQSLFDVASKSSGQCWSLTTYCPVPGPVPTSPANNDYQPGFTSAMMLKDLKLAQDEAAGRYLLTPMGSKAAALYQQQIDDEGGDLDFSSIFSFLGKTQ